jgi:hypothetical protein
MEAKMSTIYLVHAATSAGIPVVKASRATRDEALRDAEFELSGGAAFAWIVDGEGHLILPADQVKALLVHSPRARQRFARRSDHDCGAHPQAVGNSAIAGL